MQANPDEAVIAQYLLPEPVSTEPGAGSHRFDQALTILLSANADRGEWVIAQQVQASLRARGVHTAIQPQTRCTDTHATIVLTVIDRDRETFPDVSLQPLLGNGSAPQEAYRLTIRPHRIEVVGATPAGLAQGARTLIQLLDTTDALPCLTIEDAPVLPCRGVMLDISRGKVPTLATLKRIVDIIASFKLNMVQLYMENTFAFRSHPRIGAGWGALSPEDVVALDVHCRDRYVDLIPCFQSLGHHRRLLSLPDYAHLSYSPERWSLAPGEETWRFLEELYDDLLPCFTSQYVNICCDEPYDLTLTSALTHEAAVGYAGGSGTTSSQPSDNACTPEMRLYLTHVQHVHEILRGRGKTVMLWDDIFQQAPSMLAEMPPDIIYLSWFYEAAEAYPQAETIRRAGRQSMVCPGTSTWSTLFTRIENARTNIRGFVRSGLQAGSVGVLTTDWGDQGHPNLLGASWYGYAYGGSEGWAPGRLSDEEFDRRFAQLFFGLAEGGEALEALRLMSAACTAPGINKMNGSCTRAMFFRDPLTDDMSSLAPDDSVDQMHAMGKRALDALAPLHGIDAERSLTLAEMRLAARQIVHAARKTSAGRRLATLGDEDSEDRCRLHAELLSLKQDLHDLRWEYQRLWLVRNRPEGLWLSLDHFDTAAQVLDRWRSQVAQPYRYS